MKYSSLLTQPIPLASLEMMNNHFKAECDALDCKQNLFNLSALCVIQEELLLGAGQVIAWKENGQTHGSIQIPTDQGVYDWTHDGMLCSHIEMESYFQKHNIIPQNLGRRVLNIQTEKKIRPLLQKQGLGMHFKLSNPELFQSWKFVAILEEFQCHSKIGEGIAHSLLHTQERVTTTRYHLLERWDELESSLHPLGVSLSRTWPQTKPVTNQIKEGISDVKSLDDETLKSAIASLQGQYQRVKLR